MDPAYDAQLFVLLALAVGALAGAFVASLVLVGWISDRCCPQCRAKFPKPGEWE